MVRSAGLEPATPDLEDRCSIHLSYGRKIQSVVERRGSSWILRQQLESRVVAFPTHTPAHLLDSYDGEGLSVDSDVITNGDGLSELRARDQPHDMVVPRLEGADVVLLGRKDVVHVIFGQINEQVFGTRCKVGFEPTTSLIYTKALYQLSYS